MRQIIICMWFGVYCIALGVELYEFKNPNASAPKSPNIMTPSMDSKTTKTKSEQNLSPKTPQISKPNIHTPESIGTSATLSQNTQNINQNTFEKLRSDLDSSAYTLRSFCIPDNVFVANAPTADETKKVGLSLNLSNAQYQNLKWVFKEFTLQEIKDSTKIQPFLKDSRLIGVWSVFEFWDKDRLAHFIWLGDIINVDNAYFAKSPIATKMLRQYFCNPDIQSPH